MQAKNGHTEAVKAYLTVPLSPESDWSVSAQGRITICNFYFLCYTFNLSSAIKLFLPPWLQTHPPQSSPNVLLFLYLIEGLKKPSSCWNWHARSDLVTNYTHTKAMNFNHLSCLLSRLAACQIAATAVHTFQMMWIFMAEHYSWVLHYSINK